jgi:SAM-dependent methyltransferase
MYGNIEDSAIMSIEERFKERYKTGDTPWDADKPDFNLIETVAEYTITPCKSLEICCGTGDNAIWLAGNGFDVTATDVSGVALKAALEKAARAGVACDFLKCDFLSETAKGGPFGFAFDRGCFHSFDSGEERIRFARNVAAHLVRDGLWLSIIGNADEHSDGPGPPQRTAIETVRAAEPWFELLSLVSSHFGSNHPYPPRAWRCLMRKREAR